MIWFELSPKGQIWQERIMPLHSKWLSLSSVWKKPGLLMQTHWAAQRGTDRFQAIVIMASFHTDGEELNPCVSEALGRRNDIILGFAVSDEDADFGNAVSGPVFRLEAVFLYVAEGQTWKWHRRDASISAPPLSCLSVKPLTATHWKEKHTGQLTHTFTLRKLDLRSSQCSISYGLP